MTEGQGKVREKSGNFIFGNLWEPCKRSVLQAAPSLGAWSNWAENTYIFGLYFIFSQVAIFVIYWEWRGPRYIGIFNHRMSQHATFVHLTIVCHNMLHLYVWPSYICHYMLCLYIWPLCITACYIYFVHLTTVCHSMLHLYTWTLYFTTCYLCTFDYHTSQHAMFLCLIIIYVTTTYATNIIYKNVWMDVRNGCKMFNFYHE